MANSTVGLLIALTLHVSLLVKTDTPVGQHVWRDWYRVSLGELPARFRAVEFDGYWYAHGDCVMPEWYVRNTGQFGGRFDADTNADLAQQLIDAVPDKRTVIIAVIDSGIDMTHEKFAGVQFLPPRNFEEVNPTTDDVLGHGTAVASTIVSMLGGPRDWYKIGSYRVFNSIGYATFSSVAKAIESAANDGATVINFSGGGGTSMLVEEVIKAYPDVLFVFSAGNSGGGFPLCPACYHNHGHVVSVSATDRTGALTQWTNRGAIVDAPGELMYVAVPNCSSRPVRLCDNAGYDMLAGTSFSAPCVAAAVAGFLSVNATYTPEETKRRLQSLGRTLDFKHLLEVR